MLRFWSSWRRNRSQSRDPSDRYDSDGPSWAPAERRRDISGDAPQRNGPAHDQLPHRQSRYERHDHDDNDHNPLFSSRPSPSAPAQSYFDRQVESNAFRRAVNMHPADDEENDEDELDVEHDRPDEEDDDCNHDNDGDENEDDVDAPLLPIFSAAHLDRLPLYSITHAIRVLVIQKCETTLSWDQLRTPQISQFLVKPIQSQIRSNHFNRATLCALIANCLQFRKEGHLNPGNVGVSRTRAMISELLAMRLLREFSTTELIDVLSYDFDPLQGIASPAAGPNIPGRNNSAISDIHTRRSQGRGARVSTIEIAIRAEAKRFLAHPLVVQHLEAIWSGNVVFHSEADNLHRKSHRQEMARQRSHRMHAGIGYGTMESSGGVGQGRTKHENSGHGALSSAPQAWARRSATLYNPREASLFKLSRLRVPRYRQVFSTLSFAGMLALFLAVLVDRSLEITPLEIVFWFWSAGYMLDEVVGFTEQGFGLYILSFWNAFDLGILILFAIYYCLRLYGVFIAESNQLRIAAIAYDVLASTAILLFPRLFSVLDHYRYFSQLLIAFRLMAQDLFGILILIIISCSGFFVAFTLSFADDKTDASAVAYTLFQIVMGFTPAAWDRWDGYNVLGKAIMAAFLIICHFLIVTILITVLTNSFMAIVKNAEEEHQFLFAINTISMVKSDALFSYVAPSNIIGWLLSPMRFVMPMRQFVKINRTIIKVTHSPILFVIFAYERLIMARRTYGPTDLIEQPVMRMKPVAFSLNRAPELFSPGVTRLREASVVGFHKDRALEEVFRRPFLGDTVGTPRENGDADGDGDPSRPTNVDTWMQVAENEGGASPPLEQPRSVLDRLETRRRPRVRRPMTSDRLRMLQRSREFSTATRSVASDPDVHATSSMERLRRPLRIDEDDESADAPPEPVQETDADGDDEINDESDNAVPAMGESALSLLHEQDDLHQTPRGDDDTGSDIFQTPLADKAASLPGAARPHIEPNHPEPVAAPHRGKAMGHKRNTSTGTILFDPQHTYASSPSNHDSPARGQIAIKNPPRPIDPPALTRRPTKTSSPISKARLNAQSRQRTIPINPSPSALTFGQLPTRRAATRDPSFATRALDLASDIGDNHYRVSAGMDAGGISGMPASFSEQMMHERGLQRRMEEEQRRTAHAELERDKGMVNRIMLARMNTLEEGFREVLREIKDMSRAASTRRESEVETGSERASTKPHPSAASIPLALPSNIYNPHLARTRLDPSSGSPSSSLPETHLAHTSHSALHPGTNRPRTARRSTKRERERRSLFSSEAENTLPAGVAIAASAFDGNSPVDSNNNNNDSTIPPSSTSSSAPPSAPLVTIPPPLPPTIPEHPPAALAESPSPASTSRSAFAFPASSHDTTGNVSASARARKWREREGEGEGDVA